MTSSLLVSIAKLSHFCTVREMCKYAESLPDAIRASDRFAKHFKARMDELKGKS